MKDDQLHLDGIPPARGKHQRQRRQLRPMGDALDKLDIDNPRNRPPKIWPLPTRAFSRYVPIPALAEWYARMARKYLGRGHSSSD